MSDKKDNISLDGARAEFLVPQDYFVKQKLHSFICIDNDDLIVDFNHAVHPSHTFEASEFAVPDDYFGVAANQLNNKIGRARSRYQVLKIVSAIAAVWLIGILVWQNTKTDSPSFDVLLAETEIEPQDLLLDADDENIYWAFTSLCDTLIEDSSAVLPTLEKLDPRTGLPMSKAKQLQDIDWDDISPEDALKYLRENHTDEDIYN
ncbi:MAG: hypothetical protein ACKOW8_15335 [Flavobacteriales bacterium]